MNTAISSSYAAARTGSDQFPAGLSILVVDDDKILLKILDQMLRRCSYNVTTCSQATVALNLLRERKGYFDIILSDVHMPDMDGFKLLELVGLEMDLPVIMMSADQRTSIVMKGIRHGACDYLIKPIREEELKNLWQHVVRKNFNVNKEHEHGSLDDSERHKRENDDVTSSVNDGLVGSSKSQKRRSHSKDEDDGEFENDDPSSSKRPRVVWSVELHQQFVVAVNQLGIDKAVPKRILELMNVPGLTRENVASHLQKFRLYLKRLSIVAQQGGISFMDPSMNVGSPLGRFDNFQALAASGQIPPQTLAALQAELLGQPTGTLILPTIEQPTVLQPPLSISKSIPIDHGLTFNQPLVKCSNQFPQSIMSFEDGGSSGFGSWPSNTLLRPLGPTGNILIDPTQQPHQESDPSRTIKVQPSCLVVPSRPSTSFQMVGNRPNYPSLNPNSNFNRSSVIDYNLGSGSILFQGSYGAKSSEGADQGQFTSIGFVGKKGCIPNRFAVEDALESSTSNVNQNNGYSVKKEPNPDFGNNNANIVGLQVRQRLTQNDLMSVFSE